MRNNEELYWPIMPRLQERVDILILGAGWTSTFLIPLLEREGYTYAATTTDGRNGTIPFKFDPGSDDPEPFELLPPARTALIVFPLKGHGEASQFLMLYRNTRHSDGLPHFIQLGVTSIWTAETWQDETSPYDKENPRAIAEDELMAHSSASVLSLAGLYGGARQPRDWLTRVIKSKGELKAKGALHVVHGEDVARAIVALHRTFTPGKRWLLCDTHVYDWWDLAQDWATQALKDAEKGGASTISPERVEQYNKMLSWVGELMVEEDVRALPRDTSSVGRRLDGRGFWKFMRIWPTQGRIR